MFFFWRTPLLFASGIIFLSEKVRLFIENLLFSEHKMLNKYFNKHYVTPQYEKLLNFVQKLSEKMISKVSALK